MIVKKKVLVILICAFTIFVMLLCAGRNEKSPWDGEEDVDFPLDDKGYPKSNTVIVNDSSYPIELAGNSHTDSEVDSEIQIKMEENDNIVEVSLPRYLPVNYWSIEEKNYMNLASYSKTSSDIEDKNMIDGVSAEVQSFKFQVQIDETTEILLKWSNVNEEDKLFEHKKEDYLLKIVVSY